jgi:hypothetical protein
MAEMGFIALFINLTQIAYLCLAPLHPQTINMAPDIKVMNAKELDDANICDNGVHNQFQL